MFYKNQQQYIIILRLIVSIFAICTAIFLCFRYIHVLANVLLNIIDILLPFFIGIFLALVLNIPLCFFEKYLNFKADTIKTAQRKRNICIFFSLLFVFGIILFALFLLLPELTGALISLLEFISSAAEYISSLKSTNDYAKIPFLNLLKNLDIPWEQLTEKTSNIIPSLTNQITDMLPQIISLSFGIIIEIFIGIVFAIYILAKKETLKAQTHMLIEIWIPFKWNSLFFHILYVFNECFRNFIVGQATEALILGFLCTIGMLILGLPFALTVGVLVGVTALLPYIGAYLGTFIGGIIILTVSPWKSLIFIIFLFVLQQLEGNIIYPKVVGNKIQLPSIWVLFSLTVGGRLAGPVGMFLGVPTFAALYRLVKEASLLKKS